MRLILKTGMLFGFLGLLVLSILTHAYQEAFTSRWILAVNHNSNPNYFADTSLYLVNVDTGEQFKLSDQITEDNDGVLHQISWSPDGRWVYFRANDEDGVGHLYRRHIALPIFEKVIVDWHMNYRDLGEKSLFWMQDNKWIVHCRFFEDGCALYQMRPDGTAVRRLTGNKSRWVSYFNNEWLYYEIHDPEYRLSRIHLDTQTQELILTLPNRTVIISINGKWIYLIEAETQISRVSVDGSQLERIFYGDMPISLKRSAIDGSGFIYSMGDDYYFFDLESQQSFYLLTNAGYVPLVFFA